MSWTTPLTRLHTQLRNHSVATWFLSQSQRFFLVCRNRSCLLLVRNVVPLLRRASSSNACVCDDVRQGNLKTVAMVPRDLLNLRSNGSSEGLPINHGPCGWSIHGRTAMREGFKCSPSRKANSPKAQHALSRFAAQLDNGTAQCQPQGNFGSLGHEDQVQVGENSRSIHDGQGSENSSLAENC